MPSGTLEGLDASGEWTSRSGLESWKTDRKQRGLAAVDRFLDPTPRQDFRQWLRVKLALLVPNLLLLRSILRHPFSVFVHPDRELLDVIKPAYTEARKELAKLRDQVATTIHKAQPSTQDTIAWTKLTYVEHSLHTVTSDLEQTRAKLREEERISSGYQHQANNYRLEIEILKRQNLATLSAYEELRQEQRKLTAFERLNAETSTEDPLWD